MNEWNGIVEEISSKDWHDVLLWSFRIEGVDRWFRTQKTALDVGIGTTITFTEKNSQVDLASVQQMASGTAPSAGPVVSSDKTSAPGESKDDASSPDIGVRIQWQAARRDACNVMVACLQTDNMPWAQNLAKGKRLDMLRGYIKELTIQFLEEENDTTRD